MPAGYGVKNVHTVSSQLQCVSKLWSWSVPFDFPLLMSSKCRYKTTQSQQPAILFSRSLRFALSIYMWPVWCYSSVFHRPRLLRIGDIREDLDSTELSCIVRRVVSRVIIGVIVWWRWQQLTTFGSLPWLSPSWLNILRRLMQVNKIKNIYTHLVVYK